MGFAPSPSTDSAAFHLNVGKHLYPVTTGNKKAFIDVSHIEGMMKNTVRKSTGATQTWPLHWVLQSRERPGSGCNKTMLEILCPAGFLLIAVSSCK